MEDTIKDWGRDSIDSLSAARDEAVDQIREVGEEYQESADTINETAEGSPIAEECEEKAQNLEAWAGEIEGVDLEEFEDDTCSTCNGSGQVECGECDPSGSEPEEAGESCSECDGAKEHACPDCDGEDRSDKRKESQETWAQNAIDEIQGAMDNCPL